MVVSIHDLRTYNDTEVTRTPVIPNLCSGALDTSRMVELVALEFLVFLDVLRTDQ